MKAGGALVLAADAGEAARACVGGRKFLHTFTASIALFPEAPARAPVT